MYLQSLANAVFRLASNNDWVVTMREEVENVLKEEGYTKTAFLKMHKVDSFLKESQRFDGLASRMSLSRPMLYSLD